MKWESSKCSIICETEHEVNDGNLELFICNNNICKTLSATYLGLSMTAKGLKEDLNVLRGKAALDTTSKIASDARLVTAGPWDKAKYVLDTRVLIKHQPEMTGSAQFVK